MRRKNCVPMIALCLVLAGCGEATKETTAADLRQLYQGEGGCTMTAAVRCDQEGRAWEGKLRCDYVPEGESTVEVLEPELIAGVKAIVSPDGFAISYEGQTLNIGALTEEELSPADCLPRLMEALRSGWLLEENKETWNETECIRLMVDQTGSGDGKLVSTLWLRLEDGAPVHAELAVEEEVIFTVEFTEFEFRDTMIDQEAAASGK